MNSIFTIYQQLNESFQSKYVRMFAQDAGLITQSFQNFAKFCHVDFISWDKITDDDITVISVKEDTIEDVLKMFRALRAQKDNYYSTLARKRIDFKSKHIVLLGYLNNRLQCVYNNYSDSFYSIDRKTYHNVSKPKDMESHLEDCDMFYVISVDQHKTTDLTRSRRESRYDMIPDLDAADRAAARHQGILGKDAGGVGKWEGGEFTTYCKKLVEQAKERWHKILAENKFKKTSDTKEIDDLVEKTMQDYFSFMQKITKESATNKKISKYDLSSLTKLMTGEAKSSKYSDYGWLQGGLLNQYQSYCSTNIALSQGTQSAASEIEDRDKAAKYIKETIDKYYKRKEELMKRWEMKD